MNYNVSPIPFPHPVEVENSEDLGLWGGFAAPKTQIFESSKKI